MAGKAIDSSGNSSPSIEDAHPISKIVSYSDFLRFKRGSNPGTGEFQTSIVTFTKSFPILQVDLVSAVHVADRNYFTTLQKEFELYDCVLFELVTFKENLDDGGQSNGLKRVTGSRSKRVSIVRFIQRLMAIVLGLCYQLDCLSYRIENWYHADLDEETFNLLQRKKGENFFTLAIDMAVGSMKNMLRLMIPPKDIGPWRSKLLWASRGLSMPLLGLLWGFGGLSMPLIALFIGASFLFVRSQVEYPEIEALFRLDFGAAIKLFLAKLFASGCFWMSPKAEERSVLIGERNKAAIEALRRAIDAGHNKIAIFYGGGHMVDLGKRLEKEFGLSPTRVKWLAAWSIGNRDTRKAYFRGFSGWNLNRFWIRSFLVASSGRVFDLWQWKVLFREIKCFGSTILTMVNLVFQVVFIVKQYLIISEFM